MSSSGWTLVVYSISTLAIPNTAPMKDNGKVGIAQIPNKYQLNSEWIYALLQQKCLYEKDFLPLWCNIKLFPSNERSCKHDLLYHPENHSVPITLKTNTRCLFILFEVNAHNCQQHWPLRGSDCSGSSSTVYNSMAKKTSSYCGLIRNII